MTITNQPTIQKKGFDMLFSCALSAANFEPNPICPSQKSVVIVRLFPPRPPHFLFLLTHTVDQTNIITKSFIQLMMTAYS